MNGCTIWGRMEKVSPLARENRSTSCSTEISAPPSTEVSVFALGRRANRSFGTTVKTECAGRVLARLEGARAPSAG